MIRRLRARHRWLIPLVAFLTAAALGIAIFGRRAAPANRIPPALQTHREAR